MIDACDLIHNWILTSRWDAVPSDKEIDRAEDGRQILEMLNEPIVGITREERFDEVEGDSFLRLMNEMEG